MLCFLKDLRRKRAELSVTLRKQARDEQLLKRRAMSPEADEILETEKVMPPDQIVQGWYWFLNYGRHVNDSNENVVDKVL